jgi:IS5 family transposase
MRTLVDFGPQEACKRVEKLGDRLAEIESMIDWDAFRPILSGMYANKRERGGRPNIDEVLMLKLLVLPQWYGLSDPELERQVAIGSRSGSSSTFPRRFPISLTTVWNFRERLAETGRDRVIWEELQRQLESRGLTVKEGTVQDATFNCGSRAREG